jgi:hypothetical protein
LHDPKRRAGYDRLRRGGVPAPTAATIVAQPPSSADAGASEPAGPILRIVPERLATGPLRQGSGRDFAVGVYTEPPGIRVEAAVGAGAGWLTVSPTLLKGLDEEQITVQVRTGRLRAGIHDGVVELSTSWETIRLPVTVEVTPAHALLRAAAYFRYGGRSVLAVALSVLLLLAIVAALAVLALAR